MLARMEIVFTGNCCDEEFEFLRVDVDKCAAVGAIEVVVMGFERAGEFVALFPAHWYYLGDLELDE